MKRKITPDGFSLVELSIVLVILGLLVGGVMSGQSLIKAAELRSVTTEFQQYQTAVNVFKDKYFQLPGDMDNATAFWSGAVDDGDGNGLLSDSTAQHKESFLFWQHLALAGMITGNYTGIAGGGGTLHHIIDENAPRSRFGNGGWSVETIFGGNGERYDLDYENSFILGTATADDTTWGALLTPEEAWNIDAKIDDGQPGHGNIIALFWNNACANASASNDYDSDYVLSDTSVQCALYLRRGL